MPPAIHTHKRARTHPTFAMCRHVKFKLWSKCARHVAVRTTRPLLGPSFFWSPLEDSLWRSWSSTQTTFSRCGGCDKNLCRTWLRVFYPAVSFFMCAWWGIDLCASSSSRSIASQGFATSISIVIGGVVSACIASFAFQVDIFFVVGSIVVVIATVLYAIF